MEVTFKLNEQQFENAKKLVKEVWEQDQSCEIQDNDVYCGNLLGYCGHSFSFNPNQELDLCQKTKTVGYKGERHPFHQDGGLVVLGRIVTGETAPKFEDFPSIREWSLKHKEYCAEMERAAKQLEVVEYKTSDPRLQWWETFDYLVERLPLNELLPDLRKLDKARRVPNWLYDLRNKIGNLPEIGTPAYVRALAEGKNVELRIDALLKKFER